MTAPAATIIPVRSLTGGKTRLAGVMSPQEREMITRRMLARVTAAALDSEAAENAIVVSEDPAALTFASQLDERVNPLLQDRNHPGLLGALDQARQEALADGAGTLLVIFGDLPLLDADDVRNLLRRDAPVVIGPDRHGRGTNVLLLRPNATAPGESAFQFQFGEDSFSRHVAEAHRLGLDVATHLSAGTSFDLDTPEDLAELERIEATTLRSLVSEAGL